MSSRVVSSFDPATVRVIHRLSGVAGILCSVILAVAIVMLLVRGFNAEPAKAGLLRFEGNWLVTLFKLHLRAGGTSSAMLRGVRLMDMVILALTAVVGVGLWLLLTDTTTAWSLVGLALPVVGIIIYLITLLAGRSAVMAAVLVFALIALWSPRLGPVAPSIGILAAALLLVGDFTESLHLPAIAGLMGAGYILLVAWFMLVGIRLVRVQ